jgi:hypothetical protein
MSNLLNTFVDIKLDDIFEEVKEKTIALQLSTPQKKEYDYFHAGMGIKKVAIEKDKKINNRFDFFHKINSSRSVITIDGDDVFRCITQDTLKLIYSKTILNVIITIKFLDYKFYD